MPTKKHANMNILSHNWKCCPIKHEQLITQNMSGLNIIICLRVWSYISKVQLFKPLVLFFFLTILDTNSLTWKFSKWSLPSMRKFFRANLRLFYLLAGGIWHSPELQQVRRLLLSSSIYSTKVSTIYFLSLSHRACFWICAQGSLSEGL